MDFHGNQPLSTVTDYRVASSRFSRLVNGDRTLIFLILSLAKRFTYFLTTLLLLSWV